MAESKATSLLRGLVTGGPSAAPDPAPPALPALFEEACRQGLVSLLLPALERSDLVWARPLREALVAERRRILARTLAQCELGARVSSLLATHGLRVLPLKGVVIAETVCDVESDRPMSDTDLLVLDRWSDALSALRAAGFVELARADHAWAFRDPLSAQVLELHRSVTTAPGLFPLDREGLWARRRPGRRQQPFLPSAEDLLLQLALHAGFQHGFSLSLAQWLDFRRVLERGAIDCGRLLSLAAAARATVPLLAALLVAEAVVKARLPESLRAASEPLPRALGSWLGPRLAEPLGFVTPAAVPLARVRWLLLAGRRSELVWRTLVLPETPEGDVRLGARLRHALRRARRLVH
jgi:hypothetical protein